MNFAENFDPDIFAPDRLKVNRLHFLDLFKGSLVNGFTKIILGSTYIYLEILDSTVAHILARHVLETVDRIEAVETNIDNVRMLCDIVARLLAVVGVPVGFGCAVKGIIDTAPLLRICSYGKLRPVKLSSDLRDRVVWRCYDLKSLVNVQVQPDFFVS